MFPEDLTTDVLAAALRGYTARNAALANNVANAETPGYKRIDVSFEAALADAVRADRAAADGGDPRMAERGLGIASHEVADHAASVRSVDTTTLRVDGSNVDPDDEMAQLSANQLASQTVTSLLAKRFDQFRTAITGH